MFLCSALITSITSLIFCTSCRRPSFPVHQYHVCTHTLCHRQTSTYHLSETHRRSILLSSNRLSSPNTVAASFSHLWTFSGISETRVAVRYAKESFSTPVRNCELPLEKLLVIQLVVSAFGSFFFESIQTSLFPQLYLILLIIVISHSLLIIV